MKHREKKEEREKEMKTEKVLIIQDGLEHREKEREIDTHEDRERERKYRRDKAT